MKNNKIRQILFFPTSKSTSEISASSSTNISSNINNNKKPITSRLKIHKSKTQLTLNTKENNVKLKNTTWFIKNKKYVNYF